MKSIWPGDQYTAEHADLDYKRQEAVDLIIQSAELVIREQSHDGNVSEFTLVPLMKAVARYKEITKNDPEKSNGVSVG